MYTSKITELKIENGNLTFFFSILKSGKIIGNDSVTINALVLGGVGTDVQESYIADRIKEKSALVANSLAVGDFSYMVGTEIGLTTPKFLTSAEIKAESDAVIADLGTK